MKVDSLDDLQAAFANWRKTKRSRQEAIPEPLLARARRCTKKYGMREVVRVTKVDRSRLLRRKETREATEVLRSQNTKNTVRTTPTFSRLELAAPSGKRNPIVEVETGTGIKLRLYEQTPQMLGLLGALCGIEGAR